MPFDWKEVKNEFKGLRDLLETIPSAPSRGAYGYEKAGKAQRFEHSVFLELSR